MAEIGKERYGCLVLPVKLLNIFYASRLDSVKSMKLISLDQQSFAFHHAENQGDTGLRQNFLEP